MSSKKRNGLSAREFASQQAGQPMPYNNNSASLQGTMTQQKTLSGGTDLASLQSDLGVLNSQYHPGLLGDFTTLMRKVTQNGYDKRMKASGKIADNQFNPTKVSGSTFSSIMDNLESGAGRDMSKMYASTLDAYTKNQESLRNAINDKQQMVDKIVSRMSSGSGNTASERLRKDISADIDKTRAYFNSIRNPEGKDYSLAVFPIEAYEKARQEFIGSYGTANVKDFDNIFANEYLFPEDARRYIKNTSDEKNSQNEELINLYVEQIKKGMHIKDDGTLDLPERLSPYIIQKLQDEGVI